MVDLLFNFLFQGFGDDTPLPFKDDSVLYGKFISDIEILGDFLWYSAPVFRPSSYDHGFEGLEHWIFSRFLLDFTQLLLGDS